MAFITDSDMTHTLYKWLVADSFGRVAYMYCSGLPIPLSARKNDEDLDVAISFLSEEIEIISNENTFYAFDTHGTEIDFMGVFLNRGVFVYDNTDFNHKYYDPMFTYNLVGSPKSYITLDDLPTHIREIVSRTVWKGDFLVDKVIDVRLIE
jgi:hypothetical protein